MARWNPNDPAIWASFLDQAILIPRALEHQVSDLIEEAEPDTALIVPNWVDSPERARAYFGGFVDGRDSRSKRG